MPTVVLGRELAQQFTNGETRLHSDAGSVRALIRELETRHPGLGAALKTGMAVAIDGLIFQDALLQPVSSDAEVCFLPAIEGG